MKVSGPHKHSVGGEKQASEGYNWKCIAKQGEEEELFIKPEMVSQLSGGVDTLVGMWDDRRGERYSLGTGNNNEVMS